MVWIDDLLHLQCWYGWHRQRHLNKILHQYHHWIHAAVDWWFTRCQADIVESKLGNTGVQLEEKGQWLSNTTWCTQDSDFGSLSMGKSACSSSLNNHIAAISQLVDYIGLHTWRAEAEKLLRWAVPNIWRAANIMADVYEDKWRGCDEKNIRLRYKRGLAEVRSWHHWRRNARTARSTKLHLPRQA